LGNVQPGVKKPEGVTHPRALLFLILRAPMAADSKARRFQKNESLPRAIWR
jgi:hypothetical protein